MAYYSAWIMFWNSDKMHSLTSNVFWKYVNYVLLCLKNAGIPFQFAIILFQGYHLINLYIWLPIPKLHLLWSAVINQLKLGSDKWNLKTAGGLLYLRVDLSWVLNNSISRKSHNSYYTELIKMWSLKILCTRMENFLFKSLVITNGLNDVSII